MGCILLVPLFIKIGHFNVKTDPLIGLIYKSSLISPLSNVYRKNILFIKGPNSHVICKMYLSLIIYWLDISSLVIHKRWTLKIGPFNGTKNAFFE